MATSEQINDLVQKMSEERTKLLEQAQRLSDAEASLMPVGKTGEEQWTVKEQLAHLCEMELMYDAWVSAALSHDDPDLSGLTPARARIPLESANEHSVPELIEVMEAERHDTLALIRGLSPEDFERTASQRMFGRLTVMQWLRSFYRHDRMHMDQIAGRDPEYKPRFTGAEPDQRRGRTGNTSASAG